jgi:hypothetical protein
MLTSAKGITYVPEMLKRFLAQAIQSKYCTIRPLHDPEEVEKRKPWGTYVTTSDFCLCVPEAYFPIGKNERIHMKKDKAKGRIDPPPEFAALRQHWENGSKMESLSCATAEYDKTEGANVAIMRNGKPLVRVNFTARSNGKDEHVYVPASLLDNLEKLYTGNGGGLTFSMMDGRPENGPAGRRLLVLSVGNIPVAMVYPEYPKQVQATIQEYLAKNGEAGGQKSAQKPKPKKGAKVIHIPGESARKGQKSAKETGKKK